MKNLNSLYSTILFPVLIGLLAFSPRAQAGTAFWSAGSTTTTNWSDGGNWTGGTGTAGVPGTVLDERLTVACGTGALRLMRVQLPGRGAMDAEALLRGHRIPPGTV